MKLKSLGEFGLIERISRNLKTSSHVIVGIGDDAAAIKLSKDKYLLVSTDTLVENVHFKLKYHGFYELGWKLLAGGIADISAMGGTPSQALVTLGAPKNLNVKAIDEIYRGIKSISTKFDVDIIGGDTVSSKSIHLSATILGQVMKKELLLRSTAKVGDAILVTGDLGGSGIGLEILNSKLKTPARIATQSNAGGQSAKLRKIIKKHLMPIPRVKDALIIAKSGLATSMIDLSDGLAAACIEISRRSKVGIRIWQDSLPISKETRSASKLLKKSPENFALYGGEDYELMFTVPRGEAIRLLEKLQKKTRTKVSIVGEIVGKRRGIKIVDIKGKVHPLRSRGYEHFKV